MNEPGGCPIVTILFLIVIAILILLLFIIVIIIMTLKGLINNLTLWRNINPQPFVNINYPNILSPFPSASTYNLDTSDLAISSVMSAVNNDLNQNPYLPNYFKSFTKITNGVYQINTTGDYKIITIRGTLTQEDIESDLLWEQIPYHNMGHVHRGFAIMANNLYSKLNIPINSKILLTGHSLGAAVAELIAGRLAKERKDVNIALYVSARPRVGDLTWENSLSDLLANRWYLINDSDDVPQLPLPTMIKDNIIYGYTSPSLFRSVHFNYQTGSLINNHNPLTYQYAINPQKITEPFPKTWFIPISIACG